MQLKLISPGIIFQVWSWLGIHV